MRSRPCDTLARSCARHVLRWPAFPLAPALGSAGSEAGRPAPFVGFIATTAGPDFSPPCIAGYGSSPSRRGPGAVIRRWSDVRSPRFRRDPFVCDGVFDHGRATAPRIAAPHMLPSTSSTVSASAVLRLSRLNNPPHTIVVYASPRTSPPSTQHSLPAGAAPYLGRTCTGWIAPASWRTEGREGQEEDFGRFRGGEGRGRRRCSRSDCFKPMRSGR